MCKTLVRDLKAAEWYTVRARTNHFTLSCWFSVSWFEGRESEGSRDGEKRKEMLEDCVIHSPPCWALIRELTYAKLLHQPVSVQFGHGRHLRKVWGEQKGDARVFLSLSVSEASRPCLPLPCHLPWCSVHCSPSLHSQFPFGLLSSRPWKSCPFPWSLQLGGQQLSFGFLISRCLPMWPFSSSHKFVTTSPC